LRIDLYVMNANHIRNEPPIDDRVVVNARTDRDAMGSLYDATYPSVLRYCLRRVGRRDLAEDIVSTVFLSVASKMRDFPGETFVDFRRWIFTITTNEINATFRKTSRHQSILVQAADAGTFTEQMSQARRELLDTHSLQTALARLSEREQVIVSMRFYAGLPYDDIAVVLNMTPGSVRTALSRCLQKLRHQIESET